MQLKDVGIIGKGMLIGIGDGADAHAGCDQYGATKHHSRVVRQVEICSPSPPHPFRRGAIGALANRIVTQSHICNAPKPQTPAGKGASPILTME